MISLVNNRLVRMANDGCQTPDWYGKAFPYLMHTSGMGPPQSYASQRTSSTPQTTPVPRDRTGTWNGPAPRGSLHAQLQEPSEPTTSSSGTQPTSILLPGGDRMPLLGFGTYKVAEASTISAALEAGYRHFDCARKYGNEADVGEALQPFIAGGKRSQLFVTSKVWNDAHRPDAVRASCQQSLADLKCSYLDLFLVHWPVAWLDEDQKQEDTGVTLKQTWQAMEHLVDEGVVRHLGVSNFSLHHIDHILTFARHKPVVNQVELHPLNAQRKLVGVCLRKGVHCVAYAPLGHSTLDLMTNPVIVEISREAGKSPAQVLLRWNVQRGVACIPRSTNPKNIQANLQGLFDWRLTNAQKARIDALDEGKRSVNPDWHSFAEPEGAHSATDTVLVKAEA